MAALASFKNVFYGRIFSWTINCSLFYPRIVGSLVCCFTYELWVSLVYVAVGGSANVLQGQESSVYAA